MATDSSPTKAIVLVVEDEPLLRMAAVALVEDAGLEPIEVSNADDAIVILERRHDIKIVFTDIDMPGSMDGLKLAEAVRGRWPPIEIIVTSGHRIVTADDLPPRCIFFAKPYKEAEVMATLQRLAA